MKHVPRQSAAAVVVAGAAGTAADAAAMAVAAVDVSAKEVVAGAAVIAATEAIAGKQASNPSLKAQRPGFGRGASVPLRESSAVPLRQPFVVAALTSAGSTRLIISGASEELPPLDKALRAGYRAGQYARMYVVSRGNVTDFVVRQQEHGGTVVRDGEAPAPFPSAGFAKQFVP